MKAMGRLLLIVLPLLAVTAFLTVQHQLGIAPAPPVSVPELRDPPDESPRTAQRQTTVLAPQPATEQRVLPPGIPNDAGPRPEWSPDELIQPEPADMSPTPAILPIPDLP